VRICIRILALALAASSPTWAQWYSWEANGTLHVTNQFAGDLPADELNRLPFDDRRSAADPSAVAPPQPAPPAQVPGPMDAQRLTLRRHESRLDDRIAYLQRLRAAPAPRTNEQLRMENALEREIERQSAVVETLRRRLAAPEQ
jgi:hypothetical protein